MYIYIDACVCIYHFKRQFNITINHNRQLNIILPKFKNYPSPKKKEMKKNYYSSNYSFAYQVFIESIIY